MKRYITLLLIGFLLQGFLSAQQRVLIHNGNSVMYETPISGIDTIHLQNRSALFNLTDGSQFGIPLSSIDSITFSDESMTNDNIVYVTYNGNSATIVNPFETTGVTVTTDNGHVSVSSTSSLANIEYHLSGITAEGSFAVASEQPITISLNDVQIVNPAGAAITISSNIHVSLRIAGTESNMLSDGASGSQSATLICKGDLAMEGYGKLIISGLKKHTISCDHSITVNGGTISIPASASDGFHCEEFEMNGGLLTIHASGDGIDAGGGTLTVNSGIIQITSSAIDVKGIKSDDADYANPKAIKSEGNLTVCNGTITIRCSQTNEGPEGLESKDSLFIHGGIIDIEVYDDCINASTHIEITGGTVKCLSKGNDAIDSNGTLSITGGFIIANGTSAPEGGFDCDQSRFAITGGVVIGTGGSTSTPTANACTQNSIIYQNATAGNAICIKNSDNEIILLYEIPTYTTNVGGPGGPGGPGGGSSGAVVLFSDPALTNGNYTLLYGGTISGGTTVNGYNTGGAYSGGSTKTFTINNKVTTIR